MKIQIDQAQNPSHLFQSSKDSVYILDDASAISDWKAEVVPGAHSKQLGIRVSRQWWHENKSCLVVQLSGNPGDCCRLK